MRTRILTASVVGAISLFSALTAHAVVPGWSRSFKRLKLDVFNCKVQMAGAVQSVTGVAPTVTKIDNNNYEIRGFVGSAGIFAYCTAADVNICPNRPQADAIFLGISDLSSADASAKRAAVITALGDPQLIDCN